MKHENNFLLVPRGVEISETGLSITAPLSYAEWESLGSKLQRAHRSILWILGDWLCWGADHFNEEFSQAIEARGYSVQTLLNAQWVASRVAPHSRRRELSWSHHLEIASLETPDQNRLLDQAVDNDWGVRELRDAVRVFKGKKVAEEQAETEMGVDKQEGVMDRKTRNSIRYLVEYLEHDEEVDFGADPSDDHIYHHVARVKAWLENGDASPQELQKAVDEYLMAAIAEHGDVEEGEQHDDQQK